MVHIGHFIEGTEILGSYMAVQCECQKKICWEILEMDSSLLLKI